RPRELIFRFDQQPRVGALALARTNAHEMPAPLQARTFERELQMPLVEATMRIAVRRPGAAVPHDHGAAAVLALRNVALEIEVLHGMVFGAHRKPLVADREARPAGDRPALEHAVELEAQVVMGAPRRVLLHDELEGGGLAGPFP